MREITQYVKDALIKGQFLFSPCQMQTRCKRMHLHENCIFSCWHWAEPSCSVYWNISQIPVSAPHFNPTHITWPFSLSSPVRKSRLESCFHALVLCLRAWNCLLVRKMEAFKLAKGIDISKHLNPGDVIAEAGIHLPSLQKWSRDNHPNLS